MSQARFDLDEYTARVLDVVKGKYGLKNRNEALNKFVKVYGTDLIEPEVNEDVIREVEAQYVKHIRKRGFSKMKDKDLKNLLGLSDDDLENV